jgi:hypothetical protein
VNPQDLPGAKQIHNVELVFVFDMTWIGCPGWLVRPE